MYSVLRVCTIAKQCVSGKCIFPHVLSEYMAQITHQAIFCLTTKNTNHTKKKSGGICYALFDE